MNQQEIKKQIRRHRARIDRAMEAILRGKLAGERNQSAYNRLNQSIKALTELYLEDQKCTNS
jgi:hypothetical protein